MTDQPLEPPLLARGPTAPPPLPPEDPQHRAFLTQHLRKRRIAAAASLALSISALVLCWLPPLSIILAVAVLVLRPIQRRLIDYYQAYFAPAGFPDRGLLTVASVLAWIALALAVLFGIVYLLGAAFVQQLPDQS